MTVEIPDLLRRAMELRGLDPDDVAAKAAEIAESGILDEPEQAPAEQTAAPSVADRQESLLGVMEPPTGDELRDEGMARAESAAPPEWKEAAWLAIVSLANAGEDFTADDVWAKVGFSPSEPRALGPLLSRAQKSGMIRATSERRHSGRPERHSSPITVWDPVT